MFENTASLIPQYISPNAQAVMHSKAEMQWLLIIPWSQSSVMFVSTQVLIGGCQLWDPFVFPTEMRAWFNLVRVQYCTLQGNKQSTDNLTIFGVYGSSIHTGFNVGIKHVPWEPVAGIKWAGF